MFKKTRGFSLAFRICTWGLCLARSVLGSRGALEIRPSVFKESVEAAFHKVGRRLAWVSEYRGFSFD